MNIKWRLATLIVQIFILAGVAYFVSGKPFVGDTWFFAGLLAVAINPQLLEPYYPRPGDVIGNTVIFLLLYAVTPKAVTTVGWNIAALALAVLCVLAILGVTLNRTGKTGGFSRAARALSQVASAQVIYSVVFFLAAIEYRPNLDKQFWVMCASWGLLVLVGRVNWQSIWSSVSGKGGVCIVDGMIGPSVLLISAPTLPGPGAWVSLKSKNNNSEGIVLKRIVRSDDVWGQVHVSSPNSCEDLLSEKIIDVIPKHDAEHQLAGSVDSGSTDNKLKFIAAQSLEIGQVVGVRIPNQDVNVIYQLSSAVIEQADVRGGSHLVVQASANQLGVFDIAEMRFRQHPWVPEPGSSIFLDPLDDIDVQASPEGWQLLGNVIGTNVPIFLDSIAASEGHVAILGMTKMGKTTLAERFAQALSVDRNVTILDLTGEYVGKRGLTPYSKDIDMAQAGLSVYEPEPGKVPATRALDFLNYVIDIAMKEYLEGAPFPRTIIIDEAHQFIPEPAGLGFNAPGRDSSFAIGLLLMQVRKYGISVILISQRTAVVAKSALSQCENLIAFRSVDQTGLDYLEAVAGGEVRLQLPRLKQGQALVFGPAVSSELPVAISVKRT